MGQRGKYATIGARIGIGSRGQLVKRQGASFLDLSRPCVDVTGTISAEGATVANQRNISLIFKDDEGDPIAYAEVVELMVFASSAMLAFSAGGSTGIAAGAFGFQSNFKPASSGVRSPLKLLTSLHDTARFSKVSLPP